MSFSPLTNKLIESLRCLPGVGPKSAQRMAFELVQKKRNEALTLASTIEKAIELIGNCEYCRNLSEEKICCICANPKRRAETLCVVESPADVVAIEQTTSYQGYYFVLMGHLSPLDGIGPEDIAIPKLVSRVQQLKTEELILATNSTPEGEATAFYISEQMQKIQVKCTRIAHGVPLGGELEYLDSGTVSRALAARTKLHTNANVHEES